MLSSYFSLCTRQGCPLLTLLFALAIELLVESARTDLNIYGFNITDTSDKISLYADNVVLFITKAQFLPAILNKINLFGTFYGYKIKWTKSELMPVGLKDLSLIQHLLFKISFQTFTYLEIQINKDFSSFQS